MKTRLAQILFAVGAIVVISLMVSVPIPPPRSWLQSLAIRWLTGAIGFLIAAVTLSLVPRFGRVIGLIMGAASLAQLLVTLVGIARPSTASTEVLAIVLAPWFVGALAGATLLRNTKPNKVRRAPMPNTR